MKIKLWCSTHDLGSEEEDFYTPDEMGMTEDEITEMSDATRKFLEEQAEQFFWSEKEPSWGFEIV